MEDIEIEQRIRQLLYSQEPDNITLAQYLAKGQRIDLEELIARWGLNDFGWWEAKSFLSGAVARKYGAGLNLSALSGLAKVHYVSLPSCCLTDINGLCDLPNLTTLALQDNYISDTTAYLRFPNLDTLYLQGNTVECILPLIKLRKLKRLGLTDVCIPLESFKKLREVNPKIIICA